MKLLQQIKEAVDNVRIAVETLSGISGYDTHRTIVETITVVDGSKVYNLETLLGKKCENFLLVANSNIRIELDSDLVNYIRIYKDAENTIGRTCSTLKVKTETWDGSPEVDVNAYIVAFA